MFQSLKKRLHRKEVSGGSTSSTRYMPQRFLSIAELAQKVESLNTFDACVETADALASGQAINTDGSELSTCSVLVSPDGNLLLAEPQNLKDPSSLSPLYSQLVQDNQGDYSSAIFFGDDLVKDVDRNGFSCKGLSIMATSVGLAQVHQMSQTTLTWAEDLMRSKTEYLENVSISCDEFQSPSNVAKLPLPPSAAFSDMDPSVNEYELTPNRVGPFAHPNSTVYQAMQSYLSYCNKVSAQEKDRLAENVNKYTSEVHRTSQIVHNRQDALDETVKRIKTVQERLIQLQKSARMKWETVYAAEERVSKRHGDILEQQSRRHERERVEKLRSTNSGEKTSEEIWNVVHAVNESLDYDDFDPMELEHEEVAGPTSAAGVVSREALEEDARLPVLRQNAMNADDAVEDAAQALLNLLSHYDTLRRSSRIAAETCFLHSGQAHASLMKALVQNEKEELKRRLEELEKVEEKLKQIDVRKDLNEYISTEKEERGGKSPLGDDDDGGIAAALATLSSHVEGFRDMETFSNNRSEESDDEISVTNEQIDEALETIFAEDARLDPSDSDFEHAKSRIEKATETLCEVGVSKATGARARRSTLCYKLNSKRNSNTNIPTEAQFECLCRIFNSILTGCSGEDGGVTNAKMCIMLAQTFYFEGKDSEHTSVEKSPSRKSRSKRIYIKNKLQDHVLWTNDHFWDEALSLQVSESLTHSGVMSNFELSKRATGPDTTGWKKEKKLCWYDLNAKERLEAASQVQAVVFAQLSALAHSMLEFGCGLQRSCAFVRRMSIRHQLPTSQRAMLIKHLMDREKKENAQN